MDRSRASSYKAERRMRAYAAGLAIVTILLAACGESRDEHDARALLKIVIKPEELPASCTLIWKSKPYPMSAWGESRDLLETILGFWFGPDSIAPESLILAVSNVYSEPDGAEFDDPLGIVSFAFRTKAAAMGAESRLSSSLSTTGTHYLARKGRIVVVGGRKPRLSAECGDAVWEQTLRRLESAV